MKKCLHLGCGSRLFPSTTEKQWINLDLQPPSHHIPHNVTVVKGDFLKLTTLFPSETFAYIFSNHVLEHISTHDLVGLLYQMRMVLKDDGRIDVRVPNMLRILERYDEGCRQGDLDFPETVSVETRIFCTEQETRHRSVWTRNSARALLEMDGLFEVVHIRQEEHKEATMEIEMVPKPGGLV